MAFRLQRYNTGGGENKFLVNYFSSFFVVAQQVEGRADALSPLTRLPYAHSYGNSLPIYSAVLCQLVPLSPAYPSVCLLRHG